MASKGILIVCADMEAGINYSDPVMLGEFIIKWMHILDKEEFVKVMEIIYELAKKKV